MLEHLIYLSKADPYLAISDIDAILRASRGLNAARNITGALFFNAHMFVQVLEGDSTWLDILLASLHRDARHSAVEVVHRAAIAGRNFGSWSMAYTDRLAPLSPLFDDMTPLEAVLDGMRGDTRFVSGFIKSISLSI